MSVVEQALIIGGVSAIPIITLLVVDVGSARFYVGLRELKPRLWSILPYLGIMGLVLGTRSLAQRFDYAERLTLFLDFDITSLIFDIEGGLIGYLQALQTPELSAYFSFMYLFGYVILVAFPAVAYFCLPSITQLKELLTAYIVNDAVGLTMYIVFIAYGPRNLGRGFVEPILYDIYPDAALLTGTVNVPINVFPSLHASMAATVVLFAWRTRDVYPVWTVIATLYGTSVIFSTMYLGIHWATDVAAGILLAVAAFYIATRVVDREQDIARSLRQTISRA